MCETSMLILLFIKKNIERAQKFKTMFFYLAFLNVFAFAPFSFINLEILAHVNAILSQTFVIPPLPPRKDRLN